MMYHHSSTLPETTVAISGRKEQINMPSFSPSMKTVASRMEETVSPDSKDNENEATDSEMDVTDLEYPVDLETDSETYHGESTQPGATPCIRMDNEDPETSAKVVESSSNSNTGVEKIPRGLTPNEGVSAIQEPSEGASHTISDVTEIQPRGLEMDERFSAAAFKTDQRKLSETEHTDLEMVRIGSDDFETDSRESSVSTKDESERSESEWNDEKGLDSADVGRRDSDCEVNVSTPFDFTEEATISTTLNSSTIRRASPEEMKSGKIERLNAAVGERQSVEDMGGSNANVATEDTAFDEMIRSIDKILRRRKDSAENSEEILSANKDPTNEVLCGNTEDNRRSNDLDGDLEDSEDILSADMDPMNEVLCGNTEDNRGSNGLDGDLEDSEDVLSANMDPTNEVHRGNTEDNRGSNDLDGDLEDSEDVLSADMDPAIEVLRGNTEDNRGSDEVDGDLEDSEDILSADKGSLERVQHESTENRRVANDFGENRENSGDVLTANMDPMFTVLLDSFEHHRGRASNAEEADDNGASQHPRSSPFSEPLNTFPASVSRVTPPSFGLTNDHVTPTKYSDAVESNDAPWTHVSPRAHRPKPIIRLNPETNGHSDENPKGTDLQFGAREGSCLTQPEPGANSSPDENQHSQLVDITSICTAPSPSKDPARELHQHTSRKDDAIRQSLPASPLNRYSEPYQPMTPVSSPRPELQSSVNTFRELSPYASAYPADGSRFYSQQRAASSSSSSLLDDYAERRYPYQPSTYGNGPLSLPNTASLDQYSYNHHHRPWIEDSFLRSPFWTTSLLDQYRERSQHQPRADGNSLLSGLNQHQPWMDGNSLHSQLSNHGGNSLISERNQYQPWTGQFQPWADGNSLHPPLNPYQLRADAANLHLPLNHHFHPWVDENSLHSQTGSSAPVLDPRGDRGDLRRHQSSADQRHVLAEPKDLPRRRLFQPWLEDDRKAVPPKSSSTRQAEPDTYR